MFRMFILSIPTLFKRSDEFIWLVACINCVYSAKFIARLFILVLRRAVNKSKYSY